ncbi:hypothetical protein R1flu_009116 [Riccia fluitans]|uniref:Uncharacterized protein n=1 Tax=Riccia fluitans TaxID=41844 RepID=A0ABD1Z2C0_9MARC
MELDDEIMRLESYLLEVREVKKRSLRVVEEIGNFTRTLETNLRFLKTNLPPVISRNALGSLANEVKEMNMVMVEALQQEKFKIVWTDKETRSKLESRRQKFEPSFQLAFIIMSLNDEKLQMLISYVESKTSQHKTTESTDIQKFFADVIAAVEQLQNAPVEQPQNEYQLEELMYDPIYMNDLMWDPVKASDGHTYDRWIIV